MPQDPRTGPRVGSAPRGCGRVDGIGLFDATFVALQMGRKRMHQRSDSRAVQSLPVSSYDPIIELDGLTKKFRLHRDRELTLKGLVLRGARARSDGVFVALDGINLTINQGETFALIGQNGSGKSTLLKCIAGIYSPEKGKISVGGTVSALLELGSGFHPDLTGRENIFLNGALLGVPRDRLKRSIDKIVEFSGLGDFINEPVRTYSSGMYTRLGFAVATNVESEILLVDEVMAVGDEEFQRRCLERMHDLHKEGRTIVLVSHGLAPLRLLCDRAAWLEHGRLLAVGNPGEIIDRYVEVAGLAASRLSAAQDTRGSSTTAAEFVNPRVSAVELASQPDSRPTRAGSGELRIERVEVIDQMGDNADQIHVGDSIRVRIAWVATVSVPDPVFSVGFTRTDGIELASTTNRLAGMDIVVRSGIGEVVATFDTIPFLPGTFWTSVKVTDASGAKLIDYDAKAARFDVAPRGPCGPDGLFSLSASWSQQ